jgi:hypothetical protein
VVGTLITNGSIPLHAVTRREILSRYRCFLFRDRSGQPVKYREFAMKPYYLAGACLLTAAVMAFVKPVFASSPDASHDLAGRSLEMVRSDGGRARLIFYKNQKVTFEGVKEVGVMTGHGGYTLSDTTLCYNIDFPGNECWTLTTPLEVGRTVPVKSSDGTLTANFTLRTGEEAVIPAKPKS